MSSYSCGSWQKLRSPTLVQFPWGFVVKRQGSSHNSSKQWSVIQMYHTSIPRGFSWIVWSEKIKQSATGNCSKRHQIDRKFVTKWRFNITDAKLASTAKYAQNINITRTRTAKKGSIRIHLRRPYMWSSNKINSVLATIYFTSAPSVRTCRTEIK